MSCEMFATSVDSSSCIEKLPDTLILSINWSCMSRDISLIRDLFLTHIEHFFFFNLGSDEFPPPPPPKKCRIFPRLGTADIELRILFNITMKIYKYSQE